jgi:hypothetical protein
MSTRTLKSSLRLLGSIGLIAALSQSAGSEPAFAQGAPKDKPKTEPAKPKAGAPAKPKAEPQAAPPALPKVEPQPKGKPKLKPKPDEPAKPPAKPPVVDGPKVSPVGRWVDATPDDFAKNAIQRAEGGADDALAGLLLASSMHEFAAPGEVVKAFQSIGKGSTPIAGEARMLAQLLTPPAFGKAWEGWAKASFDVPTQASGLVKAFTIVGPFRDEGNGYAIQEGPEAPNASLIDPTADYNWGDFEVTPRRVLPDWVPAQGVPLDLYIHPRTESCTYLLSKVSFKDGTKSAVLRVAASGMVRVFWDGETVAWSGDVNPRAVLDRLAIQVELDPGSGPHLVGVKVCSSPIADEGRVRVRFTDEAGAELSVDASSDLRGVPDDRAHGAPLPEALARKALAPPPPSKPAAEPAPPKADPKADPTADPKAKPATPPKAEPPKAPPPKAQPPKPGPQPKPKPRASKVRFKLVKTPLQQALEHGDGGTLDRAIVAAVARTLAGADDSRSPKAPGLLDRVAKDPASTPDRIALAGWLSAFGANKSGWLNQAIDESMKAGDTRTASFAIRRLAESLITGGALDSAMRLLQREPFASDKDLAARVLRISLIGRTRSSLDAYNALVAIDNEQKQRIPTAVLRELTSFSGVKPELKHGYQKRLAQVSLSARDASYASGALIDGNAAFERAVATVLPFASNARSLIGLSVALEGRSRYAWAREVALVSSHVAPNLPESWEALATAREAIIQEEGAAGRAATDDVRFAQKARVRALSLRRGDAQKKAEIAYRDGAFEGKKSDAKNKGGDERFLASSQVILERAKKTPAKVGEQFERTLHFQRVVQYHSDKRVSQLIHQAREIVVEPRTQNELYERNIPYEGGDQVELVMARVHRKDGTVAQPDEQSSVGAYIKWPQLKTGDVVEYAVRSWTSQPVGRRGDPPFYFIDYVGSTSTRPVLFNEVVVDSPENAQLGVDVINGKAEKADDKVENGHRIVRYTWENPPIIADEPSSPAQTELLPLVVGSTFRSWDDFRTWYRSAIEGFSEPDDQVRREAAKILKGKKTEKEKIEALFNYVADDIKYENYMSGEYWLPNRPHQLLARRQGDCDDKAILLISLLKTIGVEATPVLVQTRMTGMPSILMGTKAAVPFFDHGIAYLPGKNGAPGTWLDATSPQSRIGPLPSMDARAKALFVYEGEAKIIDTPASSPADNGVTLDWTVKLDASGRADVKGSEKHIGDWAFQLRNNLSEQAAQAQWLEQYLGRWMSTVDLAPEISYSPEKGTLGYSAKSEGFARKEGDELAVPTMGSFSFMSSYAPLAKRTLPVQLQPFLGPSHQRRTLTLQAPGGFSFKELPPGGEAKGGAFGTAKVAFKKGKTAGSVIIETEVVFDKSTIPVAEYPAFRKWLENVDSLIRQTVRLTPAGGAAAAPPAGPKPEAAGAKPPSKPAAPASAPPKKP